MYIITMTNFNDFGNKTGDSINLSKIGDDVFTILAVEDSNYTKDGVETEGVKITTEETWKTDNGDEVSKIHTTRKAVVSKLKDAEFVKALEGGEHFKVKCPLEKVKPEGNGMAYFDLVAAE